MSSRISVPNPAAERWEKALSGKLAVHNFGRAGSSRGKKEKTERRHCARVEDVSCSHLCVQRERHTATVALCVVVVVVGDDGEGESFLHVVRSLSSIKDPYVIHIV